MPLQPSVISYQFLMLLEWLGYFGVSMTEIAQEHFGKCEDH
jgi:hypothetical protein